MARSDACKRGHIYTEASCIWRSDGSRKCRICDKLWREASKARLQLRAEGVQPQPIGRSITIIYPKDKD